MHFWQQRRHVEFPPQPAVFGYDGIKTAVVTLPSRSSDTSRASRHANREAQRGHDPRQASVNEQLTIYDGASSELARTKTVEA